MGSSLKKLRGNADGVSCEEPDNKEVPIKYENIILLHKNAYLQRRDYSGWSFRNTSIILCGITWVRSLIHRITFCASEMGF